MIKQLKNCNTHQHNPIFDMVNFFLNKNKIKENLIPTNLVGWPIKSGDY